MPTVTKNRQRAFTIVEVLVALAILVFGLGSIYMHMVNADRTGRTRLQQMQVRWLAQERLAELRAAPYASLKAWQPGDWQVMSGNIKALADKVEPQPDGSIDLTVKAGLFPEKSKEPVNVVTVRGMVAP
ncbi:prepilin-type N-terminal cleavage/methylation domain-containing protein [bacterium]|nr:prepilin-type N-terminal cleavage/methylation domain-containing protein [bacterium]